MKCVVCSTTIKKEDVWCNSCGKKITWGTYPKFKIKTSAPKEKVEAPKAETPKVEKPKAAVKKEEKAPEKVYTGPKSFFVKCANCNKVSETIPVTSKYDPVAIFQCVHCKKTGKFATYDGLVSSETSPIIAKLQDATPDKEGKIDYFCKCPHCGTYKVTSTAAKGKLNTFCHSCSNKVIYNFNGQNTSYESPLLEYEESSKSSETKKEPVNVPKEEPAKQETQIVKKIIANEPSNFKCAACKNLFSFNCQGQYEGSEVFLPCSKCKSTTRYEISSDKINSVISGYLQDSTPDKEGNIRYLLKCPHCTDIFTCKTSMTGVFNLSCCYCNTKAKYYFHKQCTNHEYPETALENKIYHVCCQKCGKFISGISGTKCSCGNVININSATDSFVRVHLGIVERVIDNFKLMYFEIDGKKSLDWSLTASSDCVVCVTPGTHKINFKFSKQTKSFDFTVKPGETMHFAGSRIGKMFDVKVVDDLYFEKENSFNCPKCSRYITVNSYTTNKTISSCPYCKAKFQFNVATLGDTKSKMYNLELLE